MLNLRYKPELEQLQSILDQIPIRHDIASHLMLLGVVQGFFLSFVIFARARKNSAITFLGWSLFFQSLVFLDTYLCYTGLIKYMLHFNDSTEVFVLLIAPTIYFFTYALLERKPITLKKHWPHFLLPFVYGLSQINYYKGPLAVKLNAYLGAYYDNLGYMPVPDSFNFSYHIIKDEFRWMILFSFVLYLVLSARLVFKSRRKKGLAPKKVKVDKYAFSRNTVALFVFLLIFLFLIFLNHDDDGGDHYIAILQTVITFITTFFIISESRFFENSWIADKYETLTTNGLSFIEIESFIHDNNYFESSEATLNDLAKKLETNPNLVSKLINTETGNNFNDYINQKRVQLAQEKLVKAEYAHLTVEAIGNLVGFSSKSAFYNAFKKYVGTSPSQYSKNKVSPEL